LPLLPPVSSTSAYFTVVAINTTAALNGTMQAVVWNGQPYNMSMERVPIPQIANATGAIIKLITAAICGMIPMSQSLPIAGELANSFTFAPSGSVLHV
jgi:hypothetical protein